jgi:hypothetical protein
MLVLFTALWFVCKDPKGRVYPANDAELPSIHQTMISLSTGMQRRPTHHWSLWDQQQC